MLSQSLNLIRWHHKIALDFGRGTYHENYYNHLGLLFVANAFSPSHFYLKITVKRFANKDTLAHLVPMQAMKKQVGWQWQLERTFAQLAETFFSKGRLSMKNVIIF